MIPERIWPGYSGEKIEVVVGCMFSGKTSDMIDRIVRARIAKQKAQIFKPDIDNRYGGITKVNSHNGREKDAIPVSNSRNILTSIIEKRELNDLLVVGIDETQFFDKEIVPVIVGLRSKGFRVIATGLNTDFRGEPFGPMPELLALAEDITKKHAICTVCGEEGDYTQRIVNDKPANYDDPIIMIGASEAYEARCHNHHVVPGKPRLVPKQGE